MNIELNKRLDMTLSDRLNQSEGWVYMTGMQALVRLPIAQRQRDSAAGLNTGGYRLYLRLSWQPSGSLRYGSLVCQ